MNPFTLGTIESGEPFCDRKTEIEELTRHALNCTHVVVYAPRRIGKTSLAKQVAARVKARGSAVIFADLFSVADEKHFIQKFFSASTSGLGRDLSPSSLADRIGKLFMRIVPTIEVKPDGWSVSAHYNPQIEPVLLVEDIFNGIRRYLREEGRTCLLVFDEFQEISALGESKGIEGQIREHLMGSRAMSCFFVGSRRRILQDMFSEKSRPLYKLAFQYPLGKIPRGDMVDHLVVQFDLNGKRCSPELAGEIYDFAGGYTYYIQKLAHILYDLADRNATEGDLSKAQNILLSMEAPECESVYAGLPVMEKRLLLALAAEPTASPFSRDYMARHRFSLGGTQKALDSLQKKDHVERDPDKVYSLTDPLLALWCREAGG